MLMEMYVRSMLDTARKLDLEDRNYLLDYTIPALCVFGQSLMGSDGMHHAYSNRALGMPAVLDAPLLIYEISRHHKTNTFLSFTEALRAFEFNCSKSIRHRYCILDPRRYWTLLKLYTTIMPFFKHYGWQAWLLKCMCPLCINERKDVHV